MKTLVIFLAVCETTFAADYISFYPGKDAPSKMRWGVFEGSNGEAVARPYIVIHTIVGIPTVKWNKVVVDLENYRYLRYRSAPNAYGYVADIKFYRNGVKVAGTPYGTDGSFYPGRGIDKALDGTPNTIWVAPIASGAYVGIDTGLKGTRFGDTVGLNVKYVQGEPWEPDVLTDLGDKWVRDVVGWDTMEPAPGIYLDFPQDMKDRLAFYKAHDIGVVFGLWYDNPAYVANTLNAEAYGN